MTEPGSERPYRWIDHTGDLGFEVEAGSLPALFEAAAAALLDILFEPDGVEPLETCEIHVEAADREELLVAFLGEILFLHEVEDRLFRRVEVISEPDRTVTARLFGETFDPGRHIIRRQIKAVTYHGLVVEPTDSGWRARIILDI